MRRNQSVLPPAKVGDTIRGMYLPVAIFGQVAVVSLARSRVHLLETDGGAGSVAGITLSGAGADAVVSTSALWGSARLVLVIVQLVVVWRYRARHRRCMSSLLWRRSCACWSGTWFRRWPLRCSRWTHRAASGCAMIIADGGCGPRPL